MSWNNSERVVYKLSSSLALDLEELPVDLDFKRKLILHGQSLWIRQSSALAKREVNKGSVHFDFLHLTGCVLQQFLVKHHLTGVVNGNFLVGFHLAFEFAILAALQKDRVRDRVSSPYSVQGVNFFALFVSVDSVVDAHDHLVSVDVHVSLHQRDWLGEDVEAGTYKVYREDLMVTHNTENSFVVVDRLLRQKVDNDSR